MEGSATGAAGVAAFGKANGGNGETGEGGLRQATGQVVSQAGGAGEAAAEDDHLGVEGEAKGHQELGGEVEPDLPGFGKGLGGGAVGDNDLRAVGLAGEMGGDAGEAGGGEVGLGATGTAAAAGQDRQAVGKDRGGGEGEVAELAAGPGGRGQEFAAGHDPPGDAGAEDEADGGVCAFGRAEGGLGQGERAAVVDPGDGSANGGGDVGGEGLAGGGKVRGQRKAGERVDQARGGDADGEGRAMGLAPADGFGHGLHQGGIIARGGPAMAGGEGPVGSEDLRLDLGAAEVDAAGDHGVTGWRRTPETTRVRVPCPAKGSSTFRPSASDQWTARTCARATKRGRTRGRRRAGG